MCRPFNEGGGIGLTLGFFKAGYNVAFEPIDARARIGTSKIRFASDGARFLLILLKVITIFSPLRILAPISALAFAVGAALVMLVGLISGQIATLRFEGRG